MVVVVACDIVMLVHRGPRLSSRYCIMPGFIFHSWRQNAAQDVESKSVGRHDERPYGNYERRRDRLLVKETPASCLRRYLLFSLARLFCSFLFGLAQMSGNLISTFEAVDVLKPLHSLTCLYLEHNPLYK